MKTCYYCGSTGKELRPYGPGGSDVCFPCAMETPEREAEAKSIFGVLTDMTGSLGVTLIGTEQGPINVDIEDIEKMK